MIEGLSKAVYQFLAPALSLTSFLLTLFAYLSPVLMLQDKVALLTVSPSLSLTQPTSDGSIDGPSVFLGPLGSCQRTQNDASITCAVPSVSPHYNLTVLPSGTPDLLSAPTATTPVFIGLSLAFTLIFFLMFTFSALSKKLGKAGKMFEKSSISRYTAWIGIFGFMFGLIAFLVIRMWFGKAVEDFNTSIKNGGSGAPQLIASIGNGFILVYIAYAFYAVPLVIALAKLPYILKENQKTGV